MVAGTALWSRGLLGSDVRPNAIRRLLGSERGTLRTQVIGVCGMSCSGKSTVSSVLQHGQSAPLAVPQLGFYASSGRV